MARNEFHDRLMEEYYAARDAQEHQAEMEGYGYSEETAEFYANHPRITFKEFLIGRKGVNNDVR